MSPSQRAHGHALRRGRWSEPNRIYLVTCVTAGRLCVLKDLEAGRCVVTAMKFQQDAGRADTLTYVVMPEHFHWIVQLRAGASLSRIVHSVKTFAAKGINALRGTRGRRLWQPGFHDHALRSDENVVAAARYVVANPLRAGLVRRLGDYPLWDAAWLE